MPHFTGSSVPRWPIGLSWMQLDSLGDGPNTYKLAVDSYDKVQIVSIK